MYKEVVKTYFWSMNHESYEKRQVNRMDGCDSHGRSRCTGYKGNSSLFCFV